MQTSEASCGVLLNSVVFRFFLLMSLMPFLVAAQVAEDSTVHLQSRILNDDASRYQKPKQFEWLTALPYTFGSAAKLSFRKESVGTIAITGLSTILLLPIDQPIFNGINQFSSQIHLDPSRNYKTLIGFDLGDTRVNVYELPQNLNTVLYSLGEGSTSMFISGGLYVYGKIKKDYRSSQAASDIVRAQLAVGITTQLLKRISGRESPFVSTASGGMWRPFTNPSVYQRHVPSYDAFPSGHLASMMATVTVLALHYPEKKWIRPVGYALMGLVSLAMVNNGVHWMSDYPLALAIGYVYGRATVMTSQQFQSKRDDYHQ